MSRRHLRTCAVAVATMSLFLALVLFGGDIAWLRQLETVTLDLRLQLRGAVQPGPEVLIVMIDDATIAEEGRWPLPRARLAQLVESLDKAGAKVIVFDLLLSEPERQAAGDEALARAMRAARNVVLPFTFEFGNGATNNPPAFVAGASYKSLQAEGPPPPLPLKPSGILAPIAPLGSAAAGLGHAIVAFDVDGAPRYDYPVLDFDLDYYPSLPIRIVQAYLGVPWDTVKVKFSEGIFIGSLWVPTDRAMRTLVNYRGPSRTFPTLPFSQALAGAIPASEVRGRIVLVGTNVTGIRDTFRTPFTSVLPGVERLASLVDTTLHGDALRRPESAPYVEAGVLMISALFIALSLARLHVAAAAALNAAAFVALAYADCLALARLGHWYAAAVPALGLATTFTVVLAYRIGILDRDHRWVRSAFARYLAPKMVERLSESPELLRLGGELRELTLMFCDVRGFSAMSERLEPQQLTLLVNEYFTPMTDIILEHGGTIDKYIGDGIMAFWNAPLEDRDHAEHACRAALAMANGLWRVNERLAQLPLRSGPIAIGIGINTGVCTVGNFASRHRFDYSALGDAVNVAARIEGETKAYRLPILIGPECAAHVTMLATLPVDLVRVRGRSKPIEIFALVGDETMRRDLAFAAFHHEHRTMRAAIAARDWDRAESLLPSLRQTAPAAFAHVYESYAERISSFRAHPPAQDWDGSILVERRHQ